MPGSQHGLTGGGGAPVEQAGRGGFAAHEVPVPGVDGSRVDADDDLALSGQRHRLPREGPYDRGAVALLGDGACRAGVLDGGGRHSTGEGAAMLTSPPSGAR
jgi:hypothetical protein